MAFVFKAEREVTNEKMKVKSDIGPGEYLPQPESKTIPTNKIPFLSSNKKLVQRINDVPGPGAYYRDNVLVHYLKNVQNEKISKMNDKISLISHGGHIDIHTHSEKIGFNVKSKRFSHSNDCINPGPGYYFPLVKRTDKNKVVKLREEELLSKQKIQMQKINEFQRIPTIPSREQEYGFEILDNGALVQKQNPNIFKCFSGEKGDTVGPGSYELEKPNNWHKTGTEWSKLKVKRDFYQTGKTKNSSTCLSSTHYSETASNTKNSYHSPNTTTRENIMVSENESMSTPDIKIKTNKMDKNIFKFRILKCQKLNKKKANIKDTFENAIQGNYPGPGYYCDSYRNSSFRLKPNPEFRQSFGSKLERFFHNKSSDNFLGPGQYLGKTKIFNKTSNNFAPFSSNSKRFSDSFIPQNKNPVPGPGQYNLSEEKKAKALSPLSPKVKFGSNEKRFVNINTKWKYFVPGPGYYNPEEIKSQSFRSLNTSYTNTFIKVRNNKNKTLQLKKILLNQKKEVKENSPPIGLYNPDTAFTIEYRSKKKAYETNHSNVAFDSSFNKKNEKKVEISNLGPGYYFREKKIKNLRPSPQFQKPEKEAIKKWLVDPNPGVGPGKYDVDNYFEWNKKSFNINFV